MTECQKRGHRKLFITCEDCHQVVNHATFKEPNEWISVKDKLPEPKEKSVHCILENGVQHIVHYCDDIDEWIAGGWENCTYCGGRSKVRFIRRKERSDTFNIEFATHWMPMPAPPKES